MPVGIRNNLPGVTQEQFDAINKQVDVASDPPPGLIFHASARSKAAGVLLPSGNHARHSTHSFRGFSDPLKRPASSYRDRQTSQSFLSTRRFRPHSTHRVRLDR
jgi:hypothetical protein